MWEVYQRLQAEEVGEIHDTLVLDYQLREKGRFKTVSASGEEVRVFIERGRPLAVGEVLLTQCGKQLRVAGALEPLTVATASDWLQFSKACYHLGNRHVKLQIGECWLRMPSDHVLEEMLELLGLSVKHEKAIFDPEIGAYGHHHHH